MTQNISKIAIVIPKYGLVGGAEHFVSELTKRLSLNRHYDIHVFANKWLTNSENLTFHRVPVIIFPKFMTTISFAFFAKSKMAKMNFHLIHTHERIFKADMYTMHGTPHRFWIHEVRKKRMSLHDRATEWVEKILINNARCRIFLPVSQLTLGKFLQAYDVDSGKVQVIHPGVNVERFHKFDREQCRQEVRNIWKIGLSDVVILFVSMNFDIKGLDTLMAAVAKLKQCDCTTKIKLLVVGKGEEKKYQRIANNLGISNDVIFAGVHKEKLERIYLASDVFSILSKFDTFGITVLEAMAASLPVVVSGNVGAKDLVMNGINGFIMEERDNIDAISEKIAILSNKEQRTRMGKAAHETALINTWESVGKKYERIYDDLLEQNS